MLKPGESVETLIASEPGAADRLTDEMTWRFAYGSARTGLTYWACVSTRTTSRSEPVDDHGRASGFRKRPISGSRLR